MIDISGQKKTQQEIRQKLYENIIDEATYVARGSEGAVSMEWIMNQPVFIRKRYFEQMKDEVAERNKRIEESKRKHSVK